MRTSSTVSSISMRVQRGRRDSGYARLPPSRDDGRTPFRPITVRVEAYDRTARNADELDRLIAAVPADVAGAKPETVAQLESYIALLREAAPPPLAAVPPPRQRLMLKVEFGDGRWDVTERELEELPAVGDSVRLADGRMSRVREIQTVLSGRTRKPPRPIVVCTVFA